MPNVVLKGCLDDMAALNEPFEMSDDDDDDDDEGGASKSKAKAKKADSSDPFVGSLSFKVGRSTGSSLYYVDYNKTKNNGNPDPAVSNELSANIATAEAEQAALDATQKSVITEATKLFSEPTNDEAAQSLAEEEPAMEALREKVAEARKLKVNEEHRKKTKHSIDLMTAEWRKRQRLCRDFFIRVEEMTEGAVSMKKCFKGDGQIEVESDEAILAIAKEYNAKKRSGALAGRKKVVTKRNTNTLGGSKPAKKGAGMVADENFIGVTLSTQGTVKREYFTEN